MNNETMNYHQDFEGRQNEKFMEKPINPLPKTIKKTQRLRIYQRDLVQDKDEW